MSKQIYNKMEHVSLENIEFEFEYQHRIVKIYGKNFYVRIFI